MPVNVCFVGRGLLEIKAGMLITRGGGKRDVDLLQIKTETASEAGLGGGGGGIIVIAFRPLSRFPPLG